MTEAAAKKCMETIAYKPILANFTDVNGELDFTSHDFEYNEDGSVTYYEKQVGCFTADKPYMKQDDEHEDRMYVYAKCAIPRGYTAAADIIERKGGTKVSAELSINKMSYDSKERTLLLEDVVLMGLTLLGTDPESGKEVSEGMEGARLDIADFSADKNCSFSKDNLIDEITQAVMARLDNHINNQRKEECGLGSDNFENNEVINDEVTEAEATEENVADESIEDAVVETESVEDESGADSQEESTEVTEVETTEEVTPEVVENFDGDDAPGSGDTPGSGGSGGSGSGDTPGSGSGNGNAAADNASEPEEGSNEAENLHGDLNNGQNGGKKAFSINGITFEVSLSEIQASLCELVNNTYSESDNDYYYIDVYEGSKTVVMCGMFTGRAYKQGYKVRNNVYSLVGDRVSVKAVYVTADEEAELDRMRSNYSAIADKLAKYESEPEKMNVLNSSDYANIANQKDFEELKKQENHFDLSVDEVKNKADAMLLQYAKSGKLNFVATQVENDEPKKDFFAFARTEQKSAFLDGLLKGNK